MLTLTFVEKSRPPLLPIYLTSRDQRSWPPGGTQRARPSGRLASDGTALPSCGHLASLSLCSCPKCSFPQIVQPIPLTVENSRIS